MNRLHDYKSDFKSWEIKSSEEHHKVFAELAPEWFKKWPMADDFYGCKPYEPKE